MYIEVRNCILNYFKEYTEVFVVYSDVWLGNQDFFPLLIWVQSGEECEQNELKRLTIKLNAFIKKKSYSLANNLTKQ